MKTNNQTMETTIKTWEDNFTQFSKRLSNEENICSHYRTVVIDYPGIELRFNTRKLFKSNEERTSYLHKMLKKHKVNVPNHDINDLVVEFSQYKGFLSDLWVVGS
jgi:hypothetical protein